MKAEAHFPDHLTAEPKITLSVIVCTYNRPHLCCETVRHLGQLISSDTEIIVVDQSPDHSRIEADDLPPLPQNQLKLLKLTPPSLTRARNLGLQKARGEIILFVDDDVIPDATLLTAHQAAFFDPHVGGVAGQVRHAGEVQGEGPDPRIHEPVTGWLHCQFNHRTEISVPTARGCNMSFRKELLMQISGFDENFGPPASFREDTDVCFSVRRLGFEIRFLPNAGLLHLYSNSGGTRGHSRSNRNSWPAKFRHEWGFHRHFCDDLYFTMKHFSGADRRILCRLALKRRLGTAYRWPHRLLVRLHYPLALWRAHRLVKMGGHRIHSASSAS